MKTYDSKHEIFKDFQVAVKFRLKYDVSPSAYDEFFDALRKYDQWKIEEFNDEVHHLNTHYPISVGLFIDVPVQNRCGKTAGVRHVLLEHESGPEIFIAIKPFLEAAGSFVAGKAISAIKEAMRRRWPSHAMRHESPILYVEIRTADKGNMRIKFEDFEPTQLTCLIRKFSNIEHISDSNSSCFNGLLFDSDENVNDNGI